MIDAVFKVLRDGLADHLWLSGDANAAESDPEPVVFFSSDSIASVEFKLGAVTMMLVNLEEDRAALPADPYRRTSANGATLLVRRPVPMNVYVLFVARFADYLESLRRLSLVVQFFQRHPVIDHESTPTLSPAIHKLVCELVSIPLAERNQVWTNLNTAYQPSLIYKLKMVVFHDEDGVPAAAPGTPILRINS